MKALFSTIQDSLMASTYIQVGKWFSNYFGHDPEREEFIHWGLVYTQIHTPEINAIKNTYSYVT